MADYCDDTCVSSFICIICSTWLACHVRGSQKIFCIIQQCRPECVNPIVVTCNDECVRFYLNCIVILQMKMH